MKVNANDSCGEFRQKPSFVTRPCCVDCINFSNCPTQDIFDFCGDFKNAITEKDFEQETNKLSKELEEMIHAINSNKMHSVKLIDFSKEVEKLNELLLKGDIILPRQQELERYFLAKEIFQACF